ncbi:hypothetical protein [Methylobacterium gnaphalii]|uniref:Uncharacterized protein n=1 Tax=Methylobacterium gnaphalii TaxID=1010610 RepID=A0A512JME8_9HYPH|nr:hypothetical protein [Methylobacterium gnaphalii]GEP11104.1 hypothetical protein MGN01_29490 [Methylobacterium gnaphalii]GJD69894.1 hypothetical protein MMMDOFMJ_2833 [Methylobacterium gnaphalii]GLS50382.1 hypothetical protein GCM10007885_32340 [Methylobacterium gnaphalii]
MSWFFPDIGGHAETARFDAVLAQNIEAQERAGQAAEDVTQAADENREQVGATVAAFKERTERRLKSRNQTLEQLLARDL